MQGDRTAPWSALARGKGLIHARASSGHPAKCAYTERHHSMWCGKSRGGATGPAKLAPRVGTSTIDRILYRRSLPLPPHTRLGAIRPRRSPLALGPIPAFKVYAHAAAVGAVVGAVAQRERPVVHQPPHHPRAVHGGQQRKGHVLGEEKGGRRKEGCNHWCRLKANPTF